MKYNVSLIRLQWYSQGIATKIDRMSYDVLIK